MFKVIVADDEAISREYLYTLIDWKAYGLEICGEARNGIEVLEICERVIPDIALIDINMPIMDGLVLAEKLKEKYNDICIVLITGYDEFEYAKNAIKIGIEGYISKPFDENELVAALIKIKGKLQKQRDEKVAAKDNLMLKRERELNILLEGGSTHNDDIISTHQECYNINLNEYLFIVSTVEIDNLYQKWSNVNDIMQRKYSVCNAINDNIKVKGKHIIFNGPENRIISMVGFINNSEIEDFISEIYEDLCIFIRKNFDFTVTIGVGTVVNSFNDIRASYLNALDALKYKDVFGIGNVLVYSKIKSDSMNLGFYSNKTNEKIIMYLRLNDFEHIKEELDNIINYYSKKKLSIDYIYAIIVGLKCVCMSYITEMGKNIDDVLGKDFSPMQIITNRMSIEMAYKFTLELFEKTINYFQGSNLTKTNKIAEITKAYVDINYKDNELNLEKIAKKLFLSPDYLRKVFKKELNVTLSEYITSVRMRKAAEMLDGGNIKFSSLCYDVGFSDASYFSKCFKKCYGLSPRDYENMKN